MALFDDAGQLREVNESFALACGWPTDACLGRAARELPFEQALELERAVQVVLRQGGSIPSLAVTRVTRGGSARSSPQSIELHEVPGEVRGVLAILRSEARMGLGLCAERDARLADALDRTSLLVALLTRDGLVADVNAAALEAAGLAPADVAGRPVWETPWWNHDTAVQLQLKDAVAAAVGAGEQRVELDLYARPQKLVPAECHIVARPDGTGTPDALVLIVTDLAPRRAAEARQLMLMAELDHRLKNMLSVIQAMIGQTARYAKSPEDLVAGLQGRVHTMAEVHGLLMHANSAHVNLRDLVAREIRTVVADPAVCEIVGPTLPLSPRAATALSLVIHELTTNAAKYGAFAGPGGHLRIEWQMGAGDASTQVDLTWTERSPSPIGPPTHTGFGTHLITHTVRSDLGGRSTFSYSPGGLVCILSLPVERLQDSP